jgi:hypothetical protein
VHVLPILVGLKVQFFDPVEDLLLCHGSRCVACFRQGCWRLGGFLDHWGRKGAVENCNDDDYCDCICRG